MTEQTKEKTKPLVGYWDTPDDFDIRSCMAGRQYRNSQRQTPSKW